MTPIPVLRRAFSGVLLAFSITLHAQPAGVQDEVVFDGYSPLATTQQLLSRMLTPLWSARAFAAYATKGESPPAYTLDLAAERFQLYVPPAPPLPRGYGLVVFIPPWPDAVVPRGWRKTLDANGLLFVTAASSGNDAPEIPRRVALALHGYANVSARYQVDPERVYVAGFSGGARVALHLALSYPDVFRGALLDGGSDTIGGLLVPLPEARLLQRAQEHSRLVYLYGSKDEPNASRAQYSMESARALCLNDVSRLAMLDRGHEPADSASWNEGIRRLEQPPATPPGDLADCRARVERELADAIARARALVAQGRWPDARKAVDALDARYSHLAAPASLELSEKLPPR